MARKKGSNVIGFDPLAWMKEDSQQSSVDGRQSTATANSTISTDDRRPATDDASSVVPLGESLTIAEAASLHQALLAQMGAPELAVEAGGVRKVDAAGLQLLLAFVRERERRGAAVTWRGVSSPLREAAARLGLEQSLHLH